MQPTNFDEANISLGPPEGMKETQVRTLRAYRGQGQVVTCWKPTKAELDEIWKTGRVWLSIMGTTMPPVIISADKPFTTTGEET